MAIISLPQLEALVRNSLQDVLRTLAKQQSPSGRLLSPMRADLDLVSATKTDQDSRLLVDVLGLEDVVREDEGFARRDLHYNTALSLVRPLPPVLFSQFDVTVPAVVFLPLAEAATALQNAGLVGRIVEQVAPTVGPGIVFRQHPEAGTVLPRGRVVNLAVSAVADANTTEGRVGKTLPPVEVPALLGLSLRTALDMILALGLRMGHEIEQGSTAPVGTILHQNLAAGTAVAPGTAVDLVIARDMG